MENNERKLPAIQELYKEEIEALKDQNDFNVLMNQTPAPAWVKEHPMAKGVKYIPIERIEWLLTRIFVVWSVEVRSIQVIANSVCVVVRLHYKHPVMGEMVWQDGIGAAPIQTDKGASAMEAGRTKNDAVMKAAPAAESYAVKDAAEKIGKLFGKDLNRKDEVGYTMMLDNFQQKEKKHEQIFESVES